MWHELNFELRELNFELNGVEFTSGAKLIKMHDTGVVMNRLVLS